MSWVKNGTSEGLASTSEGALAEGLLLVDFLVVLEE